MTAALDAKTVTVADILAATSQMFEFSVEDLLGHYRWAPLVRARHIAMSLCRYQTDLSYPQIARAFGNRDHITIMHAVGRIDELVVRDAQVESQVAELTARLEALEMAREEGQG